MFEPSSSTYSDSSDNDDQLSRNEEHDSDLSHDTDPGNEDESDPLTTDTPKAERDLDERSRNQSGMSGYFSPEPYRWPPLHIYCMSLYCMSLKVDIATLLQRGALYVLSPG